jgi:hypothetical protein
MPRIRYSTEVRTAILRRMHGGELRHAQAAREVGCSLNTIQSSCGIGLDIFRSRGSLQDWHVVSKRVHETLYNGFISTPATPEYKIPCYKIQRVRW